MATSETVAKCMAALAQGYDNFTLTREKIIWYAEVLKNEPDDVIEAATKVLSSSNREFFPPPGVWRQTALDIMLNKRGLPSAIEAWEEVMRMGDGSPIKGLVEVEPDKWAVTREERTWKYPLVEKVAIRCGWPEFPNPDPDQLGYDRTVFMRAYESELSREQEDLRMLPEVKAVEAKYLDTQKPLSRLAAGMSERG